MRLYSATQPEGYSLIEAMLGVGMFGLFVSAIVGSIIYGQQSIAISGNYQRAILLSQEGVEAVRAIRDTEWNDLQYTSTGLQQSGGMWEFAGEGTSDTIGIYTRTTAISDVCRDSSDTLIDCDSGGDIDQHTKEIQVSVSWDGLFGVNRSVSTDALLTHWSRNEWTQSDWSGGDGQAEWSDETMYESDDGSTDSTVTGEVTLASAGANSCGPYMWPFSSGTGHTYDSADIEFTTGEAALIESIGDIDTITDTTLDTYEFDTSQGTDTQMIQVGSDMYAVVYNGPGNDGWLASVDISSDGTIGSVQDSLEFDTGTTYDPHIMNVSGEVYAIVYRGPGNDGWLVTVDIASDGTIGTVLDSLEFDTSQGLEPKIIHITGDIYAIAYSGPGNDGWLASVDISTDGTINGVQDTHEFDTGNGRYPDILLVDTDTIAIPYSGPGSDGWVATLDVDSSGNFTAVDTFEFDTTFAAAPEIIQISDTMHSIVYSGPSNDGWMITLDIATDGTMSSITDSYEFDTSYAMSPELLHIENDIYTVGYRGPGNDGFISLVEIDSTGSITASVLDMLEFDTIAGYTPSIISIGSDNYAVAYMGNGSDGWISTIAMERAISYPTSSTVAPSASFSPGSVGEWTSFTEDALKDSGAEIYYQLSPDGGTTWYWWSGSSWSVVSGATDYSTASDIDTHISTFTTSVTDIQIQAFFTSDGVSGADLDSVMIGCNQSINWDFASSASYTYDTNDITVSGGSAELTEIDFNMEVGSTTASDSFNTVSLTNTYESPVIVTFSEYASNTLPLTTRIENVTSSSFDLKLQHADSSSSSLSSETVYYMVVEEGAGTIGGVPIEAHTYSTATVGSSSAIGGSYTGDARTYSNTYSTAPIVLHQVMSNDDTDWISTFVSSSTSTSSPPTTSGFQIGLSGAEVATSHGAETIGYIVIGQTNSDTESGVDFESTRTADAITGYSTSTITSFTAGFSSAPFVIASQQEMDGGNGGWVMPNSILSTQIDLFIDEDQGFDSERAHTSETAAFIAFESAFDTTLTTTATLVSSDSPTIESNSQSVSGVTNWSGFTETATKAGSSEIYYQLSTDGGITWQYWSGSSWDVVTTSEQYTTASDININISELDASSEQLAFKAFLVSDGLSQITLNDIELAYSISNESSSTDSFDTALNYTYGSDIEVVDGAASLVNSGLTMYMEVGSATVSDSFSTVSLANTYTSPVIVTFPEYASNTLPLSTRIDNVTSTSFDIKLQHADSSPSSLSSETVYYMVVEEGAGTIGGVPIEAHTYSTSTTAHTSSWTADSKTYTNTYSADPIVLHQVMSYNDANWITTWVSRTSDRTNSPNTSGFQIGLNAAAVASSHSAETIGYIVIGQTSSDTESGHVFETTQTSDSITGYGTSTPFSFTASFSSAPLVIASQQHMDGADGSWLMPNSISSTQIDLFVDEDQVTDSERSHTSEAAGYIAFDSAFDTILSSSSGSYITTEPTVVPTTDITVSSLQGWSSFRETSTTGSGGSIRYQLTDDGGTTWYWWDGSAWTETTSSTEYNSATDIDDYIELFSPSASQLNFRAYLISDGTSAASLEELHIGYIDSSSGSGYATSSAFVSSAYNMGSTSPLEVIEWTEDITACDPGCDIQVQLRATQDNGSGAPDTSNWTDWYGASGSGTYFDDPLGALIPTTLNGYQWVQYRVELSGDGSTTPIFEEITVSY